MTAAEVSAFLDAERVISCASNGPDGWPHVVPLWYVLREGTVWSWTYAASQKVRNLSRDPRATLQVESGQTYLQLRGVLLRATVTLHRDREVVAALGAEIFQRYHGLLSVEVLAMVRRQATKRVGLQFVPAGSPATWDHAKLGGSY